MDTIGNLLKGQAKQTTSQQGRPTLLQLEKLLQNTGQPPCSVCGFIGTHSAWCDFGGDSLERCPTCKQIKGQPGYLRNTDIDHFGQLDPCPTCHSEAIKNITASQMEGQLTTKTFDNFVIIGDGIHGLNAAKRFVEHCTGWLTLYGDHGPGKTHLCAAIANETGARYYNAPDLANSFFGQANEVVDELQRHRVVILDELDKVHWQTANGPAWVREQFQRLLDHRYRNCKTYGLVIATNKPPQWYDNDLHFIQTRMLDQRFECVKMTGDNRSFAGDLE